MLQPGVKLGSPTCSFRNIHRFFLRGARIMLLTDIFTHYSIHCSGDSW